ncbi:MAG TPA: universal stress protein [Streptosporangiaceae bacterium]|nr:universal stress protein [Streptosporangiaceae bacterium]
MSGTIVVGVGGSGHADHAVQTVAMLAADTKGKVVVFHEVAVHPAAR